MNLSRGVLVAVVLFGSSQSGWTQELFRYRAYALESSLDSVVAMSGARAADAKTLHGRPAKIQELEWRAPYVSSGDPMADPVRGAVFTFFNDALYQIVVEYDRDRTAGLTNTDLIESLTTVYGPPMPRSPRSTAAAAFPDRVLLAAWENPGSSIALMRGVYSPEFQIVLTSKALSMRAREAIRESGRLDIIEAPRREQEQRKQEIADRDAARVKARTTNKAAFRP